MKSITGREKTKKGKSSEEEIFYATPTVNNNNNTAETMDFYDQIATKKDRRRSDGPANYAYVPIRQVLPLPSSKLDINNKRSSSVNEKCTLKKLEAVKSVKDYHNIWSSAGDLSGGEKSGGKPAVPNKAFDGGLLPADDESETVCEEIPEDGPPKITEISGILSPVCRCILFV